VSRPQAPRPAKLIVGFFLNDPLLAEEVARALQARLGAIDMVSGWIDFDYTTYYRKEMGTPLRRRVLAVKPLAAQTQLPAIKQMTNALESAYACRGRRRVNIDPGYLLPERLVLASGKNFSHRIHLDAGIYADLTLIYQKGAFRALPWTYPDYADRRMIDFLTLVRRKYLLDLKQAGVAAAPRDGDGQTP
jgi:hypothetical protein